MNIKYILEWRGLKTKSTVFMLDGYIRELLEMGAKPADIKITIEVS